jgi:hypothetical protein
MVSKSEVFGVASPATKFIALTTPQYSLYGRPEHHAHVGEEAQHDHDDDETDRA